MKHLKWYHLCLTTLLLLIFMFFVLPNESTKSLSYGIIQSPDTSIFYTSETLYQLAEDYQEEGRDFYISQRFTFDLIWPIVYGLFFISMIGYFVHKVDPKKYKPLIWLPIINIGFDYLENTATSITMYRFPLRTPIIADIAGYITLFKWLSIMITVISLIFLLSLYIYEFIKFKKGA